MKTKQLVKLIAIILVISFCSLYFTTLGGYYEYNLSKKNILTEEAIARFEQDVKEGKQIIASNYIEESKDYGNKSSRLALKISNFISSSFDKIMKFVFKQIENTVNN